MAFSGTCGWNSTMLSCPTSSSGISFCGRLDPMRRNLACLTSLRQIHAGGRAIGLGEDAAPPLLVRAVPRDRLPQPFLERAARPPAELLPDARGVHGVAAVVTG